MTKPKLLTHHIQDNSNQAPTFKDYRPDVTQAENNSEFEVEEDDNTPEGQDDYDDEYDNGMPDKKRKRRKK